MNKTLRLVGIYWSFLLFFFCVLPSCLKAQMPYFINYQQKDGLPSSLIYAVFQDSNGYIWVSTDLGISKFDGKNFQNYSYQEGLADNEVFDFYEDRKGRIWMRTYNGQACYYLNGRFYNAQNTGFLKDVSLQNYISHICEDSKGNIYFSSYSEYGSILSKDSTVSHFKNEANSSNMNYLWIGKDDSLFIAHQQGFNKLNAKKSTLYNEYCKSNVVGISRGANTDKYIFLGVKNHLFIYDRNSEEVINSIHFKEIETEIIFINYFDNTLWLGTRNGVFKIVDKENDFINYSTIKYLNGLSVTSVLKDSEGGIWFSTLEEGVFYTPVPEGVHYTDQNGLFENQVFSISKDQGNKLWIGSSKNNVSIFSNDQFQHFSLHGSGLEISNFKHFNENDHWIIGQGIIVRHAEKIPDYLFFHTIDMIKDNYGYFWLGNRRLFRFSPTEINAAIITENHPDFSDRIGKPVKLFQSNLFIDDKRYTCYENSPDNRIWAGTTTGLYWYNYDSLSVKKQDSNRLLEGKISALVFDEKENCLWAATSNNGIHIIKGDSVAYSISTKEGLNSNMINRLYLDENNTLWIGTVKGVDRLELKAGKIEIRNFTKELGLYNIKINDLCIKDQSLYLATESGIIVLPIDGKSQAIQPPIHIDKFKVNGQMVDLSGPLKFDYNQNSTEFSFTGISFRDRTNINYQYRLIGADKEWLHSSSNVIQYRSLAPGDYRFEVKAENALGILSTEAASIEFSIAKPFWFQAWFLLMSCLFIAGGIYFIIKRRIYTLKKQHRLKQRLMSAERDKLELEKNFLELEMRALRVQMNPHFLFNALNTIKGYYAQDKIQEANAYISKFAKLLRLILKNTDKYISLDEEVNILDFYMKLTKIRYDHIFEYEINVSKKLDKQDVSIPPMLLQPMVENAILHGLLPRKKDGIIQVSFDIENEILISKVRDNGIGRAASQQFNKHKIHSSKATQITCERLAIINKDYDIIDGFEIEDIRSKDGRPAGTEVTIKTPLKTIWS